jgi:branched-chain amino acid transport system ATP-binding protein
VGATFGKLRKSSIDKIEKKVNDVLDLVGMGNKKDIPSEELDLFDRKRLMIATALATDPMMLMLDEPVGGLGIKEQQKIIELIRRISSKKVSIILIEHVMTTLMNLSHRVMILHHGEKICEGFPKDVANDQKVIDIYLGTQPVGIQVTE